MEDDFAQSREPDDLFADEIEPAEEEVGNTSITSVPTGHVPPPYYVESSPALQNHSQVSSDRPNNHRGGRGGRGGRGHHNVPRGSNNNGQIPVTATTPQETVETSGAASTEEAQSSPPLDQEQRVTSVRGDRSASGPARPTKKTEAELTELMSSMRLKNAAKAEAHERAEKDQASFLQREKAAELKRVEQNKALKEQERERAKNRERKIKAQGGREWDSEKQESDIVDRKANSSGYMRGAHGGVSSRTGSGLAASQYNDQDPGDEGGGRGHDTPRSRGRGSRNGRGNRGRGRAGYEGNMSSTKSSNMPSDLEFPALPIASTSPIAKDPPKPAAGPGENSTWAEEMATAEPIAEQL